MVQTARRSRAFNLDFGWPVAVPGVAGPSLLVDLAEIVSDNPVAADKDRLVRADFIETCPQRRCDAGVFNDFAVPVFSHEFDARHLDLVKPSLGTVNGRGNLGIGRSCFQEFYDSAALCGGEGGNFVYPCSRWFQRAGIMLLSPSRQLAANDDLCIQNGIYAFVNGIPAAIGQGTVNKGEISLAVSDFIQQVHDIDHRVVIIRDVFVVTRALVNLRPSAVGILHVQQKVDAFDRCSGILGIVGLFKFAGKSSDFRICSFVIDRGFCPFSARFFVIFSPSSVRTLVFQNIGNARRRSGCIRRIDLPRR